MNNELPGLVPGLKPVLELLAGSPERIETVFCKKGLHGPEIQKVIDQCRSLGLRFRIVDGEALDRLCRDGMGRGNRQIAHQGVIARISRASTISIEELLALTGQAPLPLIVALDQVQDPGNLGTLCRTMYALGCAGLILPRHNSAHLGPAASRAAAGALEKLPIACVTNLARALDQAEETGLAIYGTGCGTGCQNAFASPLELPAVLVLGNEEKGLRPGVAKRCGSLLHIPLARDFDSLNVAQAGAILIGITAAKHNCQCNFLDSVSQIQIHAR